MPFVRPYVRSDGTPVRGHYRWAPGARREVTIVAVVALAVIGFGNGNVQVRNGTTPRPESTVTYPVRFTQKDQVAPRVAVPRPTVSYPIRFDAARTRPAPRSSVSYPIDFSTMR